MEGLVSRARRLRCEIAERVVHRARHAVERQRQVGRVAEIQQLDGPLLRHAVVRLVDLRVRVVGNDDRLDRHAIDAGHDTVLAVLAQQHVGGVVPLDVDPHAPAFRVAGDQLVTGQVRDLQRVPGDAQRGGEVQLLLGAQLAGGERVELHRVEPAAEAQLAFGVLVDDRVGSPVVAAGHVVQRQVPAQRNAVLVRAVTADCPHVAGLAGEIAVGAVLVVSAGGIESGLDRAGLEIRGKLPVRGNQRLRQLPGLELAVGALDHAVLVREVVERRLAVHRRARHAARDHRIAARRPAVVVREVADRRVRHVVAGAAEIHVAVEPRLHELVARTRVAVRTELRRARPKRQHSRAVVPGGRRATVVRDEGFSLRTEVLAIVRVRALVAGLAFDAVRIAGHQSRAVGRRRAPRHPACGAVAADAQVACAVEVLLRDRERRPEDRVTARVRHHAAAPVERRLDCAVVAAVAVVALVRRVEVARLARLCARLLDLVWNDVGAHQRGCEAQRCEAHEKRNETSEDLQHGAPSLGPPAELASLLVLSWTESHPRRPAVE